MKQRENGSLDQRKFFQGKLRGYRMLYDYSKVSCLFLVYYLRFESLNKLQYPKGAFTHTLRCAALRCKCMLLLNATYDELRCAAMRCAASACYF